MLLMSVCFIDSEGKFMLELCRLKRTEFVDEISGSVGLLHFLFWFRFTLRLGDSVNIHYPAAYY
jgi:hypothetical protein